MTRYDRCHHHLVMGATGGPTSGGRGLVQHPNQTEKKNHDRLRTACHRADRRQPARPRLGMEHLLHRPLLSTIGHGGDEDVCPVDLAAAQCGVAAP